MYSPWGKVKAAKIIDKEITKGADAKFLVYYDPDIDGLMAGFLVQKFLKTLGFPSKSYINENREHGFKLDLADLAWLKGHTIIAVDFAMLPEEVQSLVDFGINIVSIDHHHISAKSVYIENEENDCKGIIINNQYAEEPEDYRFLSGAGVVYYVLHYLYKCYGKFDEIEDKTNKALVGISLLSDIRPTEGNEAQMFLNETFTNKSETISYLIDVTTRFDSQDRTRFEAFGIPCMNRNYIDYNFSPKLNALFRLNEGPLAIQVVKGDKEAISMLKEDDLIGLKKKMQNSIVDEMLLALKGEEFSSLVVKGIPSNFKSAYPQNMSNFIGLLCSRIRGEYKTTFLFVEGETPGHIKRGSVRGLYDNVNYLSIFKSFGVNCEGHNTAFGVRDTDLNKIDWKGLNAVIEKEEKEGREILRRNLRVLEVSNLSMFLSSKNKDYARYNTYVRDAFRYYIKYTGDNIQANKRGKMVEYIIDGIPVNCFDLELSPKDGLLLPVWGRGDYIEFTLKKSMA